MKVGAKPTITFVVQRSFADVVGGAEQLARAWARLLAEYANVRILTSAAVDSATWENALPLGESREEGFVVQRFAVARPRGNDFHRLHALMLDRAQGARSGRPIAGLPWNRLTRLPSPGFSGLSVDFPLALEREWIRSQGPYCPQLLDFLAKDSSDRYVFVSYLYPTTVFGLEQTSPERSYVVPTLHDELPAYFSTVTHAMRRAAGRIWISAAERRLGERLWRLQETEAPILSMPLQSEPVLGAQSAPRRTSPRAARLLYCGRIDRGKGVAELVDFVRRYTKQSGRPVELHLIGKVMMSLPKHSFLHVHGFVSEVEKRRHMRDCDVFVMPSMHESLSITVLEAMSAGRPVLVNAGSEVLSDHVAESGGGRTFDSFAAFVRSLDELLSNDGLRTSIGAAGRKYAQATTDPIRLRQALLRALHLIE